MDGPYAVTSTLVVRPVTRRGSPWRTLRAQGPPPVIRTRVVCGSHMCDPYGAGPPVSARTSRQYRTVTSLVNGPKHGAGPNNSNGSSRQSEREAVLNWFGEWAEPPRKLRFISRVGAAETALDNRSRMMFIHWWAAVCALAASLLAMLL